MVACRRASTAEATLLGKAWSGACTGIQCEGLRPYFWNSVMMAVPGVDLDFAPRPRDAEELFDLTDKGLAFFGDRFGSLFPQERYDQVFVPDLGGAMENWGCVTWGDWALPRSEPTYEERRYVADVVLQPDFPAAELDRLGARIAPRFLRVEPRRRAIPGRHLARFMGRQVGGRSPGRCVRVRTGGAVQRAEVQQMSHPFAYSGRFRRAVMQR